MDLRHENIYLVFALHPRENGEQVERSLVGKLALHDGRLDVLEDHVGFLKDLETMNPQAAAKRVWSMDHSQYLQLVSLEEIRNGEHPELQSYLNLEHGTIEGDETPEKNFFEYHRQGLEVPQTISVTAEGKVLLDGHELVPDEVQRVLDNARQGLATLRYSQLVPDEGNLDKMESLLMSLAGVEEIGVGRALRELRKAEKEGNVLAGTADELARHLFRDTLIPEMGNLKAYKDFLSRPRKGIHVAIDGNQMKSINDTHGHEIGNQAIRSLGLAIRSALDEAVGRSRAKSFRTGGDEFIAHVPTHEEAAHFSRVLRSKLAELPPIAGFHNLSVSLGMGLLPEHAEQALVQAKADSHAANYAPGKAKQHAYSLVPGFEGSLG